MQSTLSWLDYSESDRRRALDVIDLFKDRDTRDELGIGSVRDAFAEMLFPGTSTIQTRAKYFFFVPWTYQKMERLRVPAANVEARARNEEIALIDVLAESDDPEGVIGISARDTLKRLPSNVYWLGLKTLGIRVFPGSQSQYHRQLDSYYTRLDAYGDDRRAGDEDGYTASPHVNWHPGLPTRPEGFPKEASLKLTRSEAVYLKDRILANAPASLLAFLVRLPEPFPEVEFPWGLEPPVPLPEKLIRQITHARLFSEAMNGSALLYNLMLAEAQGKPEWVTDYRERLADWRSMLSARREAVVSWDRREFWATVTAEGARLFRPTRDFIDHWLNLATENLQNNRAIDEDPRARSLISVRERSIKPDRARLHNRRALELWNGDAGTAPLSYRWPQARRIALDILEGLSREASDA